MINTRSMLSDPWKWFAWSGTVLPFACVVANITAFVDNVRLGRDPETNGEAGLRVVAVLEAIQRSAAADGAFVELELG